MDDSLEEREIPESEKRQYEITYVLSFRQTERVSAETTLKAIEMVSEKYESRQRSDQQCSVTIVDISEVE